MDERTLTALEGSIAKWQAIVDGTSIDRGSDNCPLCQEFVNEEGPGGDDGCYGCPVSDKTGESGCSDTPYDKWTDYMSDQKKFVGNPNRRVFDDKSKALALYELDFLKSLLPSPNAALGEQHGEKK